MNRSTDPFRNVWRSSAELQDLPNPFPSLVSAAVQADPAVGVAMQAVNFFSYDVYRKGLLQLTRHEKVTNVERFLGGAMAGALDLAPALRGSLVF